ncbi:unnamed protein product [Trifolium pratense]|uniref:Uncharacterized protein n=1 Tax=Trifolium pratense TaxID=57577 RepID=A0ACB0JYM3_TRIPR|nr:unnamed protein product [Trifolium pratense]
MMPMEKPWKSVFIAMSNERKRGWDKTCKCGVGAFPLLVEVAKLAEADLDRKISVRSRIGVVEELGSSPIAPMCRNIMIGSTGPGHSDATYLLLYLHMWLYEA